MRFQTVGAAINDHLSDDFPPGADCFSQKKERGQRAMFIRQLKRRDESGHAVFHMQDSRKATQGDSLVWNTGKRNAHTERIEVRSFRRMLKDTNKLEFMQIHICDD